MTCRDEVIAAFESLQRRDGRVEFSPAEVVAELRCNGSVYPDVTIRTHVVAHMLHDGSLVRHSYARYRLARNAEGTGSTTEPPMSVVPSTRRTVREPVLDGVERLEEVLLGAGYASTLHGVAAHTVMLHPSVVAQTGGSAIFRTVRRNPSVGERVGEFGEVSFQPVMFDDNLSAIAAFTWAAAQGRGRDVQFNHIWPSSRDCRVYTALWNLCATPAFLAKTTDGSNHPAVVAALRRRSFELYGYVPAGETVPDAPEGYDSLTWADHPAPVTDLEAVYRFAMSTKPKDRVVGSARRLGWLFSEWRADSLL
jgi:hypothetical protein